MGHRSIIILGSTGSIGESALEVVRRHPDRFKVLGLVAGDNVEKLAQQAAEFHPTHIATRTAEGASKLRTLMGNGSRVSFLSGAEGAEKVASLPDAPIVVSAIVGAAGLRPTLAAARAGKVIALANKEAMVVAGALVSQVVREHRATLLPVDSEHSAIFQSLAGSPTSNVRRLILTASGGPFYRKPELDLETVTREEALNHPNWKMGAKITIDSATMMNKGLEIIEARWLFGLPAAQIDVVIHPQSIIHSMVEYIDGSVLAQLGVPDMKGPIAYALSYPDRLDNIMPPPDFTSLRELNFFKPDNNRFPAVNLARKALDSGETFPAVLNGSNEITVEAFLKDRIRFTDISRINEKVLTSYRQGRHGDLEDYIEADQWGRRKAMELIEAR